MGWDSSSFANVNFCQASDAAVLQIAGACKGAKELVVSKFPSLIGMAKGLPPGFQAHLRIARHIGKHLHWLKNKSD